MKKKIRISGSASTSRNSALQNPRMAQQGFATLLENAINAAFEAASTICQETYNTPPCCKEVVIVLNGVGERDGKDGTRELHRRLKGTTNNLNAPPINGVREGKKWRVPCGNEVI